ncbi:gamma-glutamyltransferase [Aquicoccus sp. SCR17]|nr:gamma-glutamyltransferase [Carideicomes alvinocaridis]
MRDFQSPGRSPVLAANGLCATSHPLAAKVAVDILQTGGNAVDAAIAGAVLLGICEPQMTSIGGDCFALISSAGEDRVIALNGSGRAPAAAEAEALRSGGASTIPTDSAHSVTLPGAIDGFCRLSADWGRLGLADSLAPAIRYAEEGVPVAPRVALDWDASAHIPQGAARRHYLQDGRAPRTGELFRAPGQAEVLRRIARDGRDAFYTGEVAEDMVAALRQAGGVHAMEDFAATDSEYGDPVSGSYKGHELMEHPPNGQGATAILILNILAQFDLTAMDPWGAERAHLEAEAAKLAYDARDRFLADADHVTRLEHMLSLDTARALAALIRPDRAMAAPAELSESVHKDTVYITVVDRDRMAVSLIYSCFHAFGSGIASDRFGVLLHNRGAGFNLIPGHANEYGPGKRPMHTIIPAMLRREGRVVMPFGVMGGQYQPAGHARVLTNMLDFGMDPQAALDGPRSFVENGRMVLETGYSAAAAEALAARGHDVTRADSPLGGAQAIRIHESGVLEGASDPRKDGCAIGY